MRVRPTITERFWSKFRVAESGCWEWTAGLLPAGYGQFKSDVGTTAHRFSVAYLQGAEIPNGMQVDHLCHDSSTCHLVNDCPHRRCVNPSHLAVVTTRENVLRGHGPSALNATKKRCKNGHEFTEENTYWFPSGRRACMACRRQWCRDYRARKAVDK